MLRWFRKGSDEDGPHEPDLAAILPNLFIVGAPKCGTTSLYEWLRRHPDAFFPFPKEPNTFATDLSIRSFPHLHELSTYLGLYSEAAGRTIRGDASQFHLYSRDAARLIARFFPAARIVIALREPVGFMQSLHAQYLRSGDEHVRSFEEAVSLGPARSRGEHLPATKFPDCMDYLDLARFAPQVARYFEAFAPEQIKVLLLDDLRAHPRQTFAQLLDFLDLPPAALDLVPANVGTRKSQMSDALERRLRAALREDVEALSGLIGRDLGAWL